MERRVYYKTDTCSTFSEDSYQETPVISPRISASRTDCELTNDASTTSAASHKYGKEAPVPGLKQSLQLATSHLEIPPNVSFPVPQTTVTPRSEHKKNVHAGGLTRKLLHSGISQIAIPAAAKKHKSEMERYYEKVLVLHLQCKNIATLTPGVLDPFCNLKNLYLYKNTIRRIQGLDCLCNLEILDLSRNNVERIDNLDNCKTLKKIYLGFNEIQVVEGLEALTTLEELHVDDQDIPPEQPLIFAPGIMAIVAHSLMVLDLSSNQLTTLQPIANLPLLDTLLASDNYLDDLDDTLAILETLRQLRILNLKGNSIAKNPIYKSKVIGIVYRLEVLDGKDINDTTRTCLQKLRIIREYRARQKQGCQSEITKKSTKIDVDENKFGSGEFNFSTPTRLSPSLPPEPVTSALGIQKHQLSTSGMLKSKSVCSSNSRSMPALHDDGGNPDPDSGSFQGFQWTTHQYGHGRTLSPVIELPTPDSVTARDNY